VIAKPTVVARIIATAGRNRLRMVPSRSAVSAWQTEAATSMADS
jgi:hypothetical protein